MYNKLPEKLKILTEKKEKLNKQKPLTADVLKNLEEWLKVELTYSSNAIEGNTLTRLETAEVIEKGGLASLKGKPVIPVLMGKGKEIRLLKIGELAEATRETRATIRFWTGEGLLKLAKLTEGGYALYSPAMIEKAREIRHLQKEERLSINEIRAKLSP